MPSQVQMIEVSTVLLMLPRPRGDPPATIANGGGKCKAAREERTPPPRPLPAAERGRRRVFLTLSPPPRGRGGRGFLLPHLKARTTRSADPPAARQGATPPILQ